MKYTSLAVLAALFAASNVSAVRVSSSFAPPAPGPYASDTDHLSTECYGADEDDIMYDVFKIMEFYNLKNAKMCLRKK